MAGARRIRARAGAALVLLAALGTPATAAALPAGADTSYLPCPKAHPSSRAGPRVKSLAVSHLAVSGLSCASAVAAVRAGTFALTPGGAIFHTGGFGCDSPIGAPRSPPVPYRCSHAQQRFEFFLA